ncbi:ABC transporter permease [Streptomyces sp. NPDC051940]|uniref:ABC transporter permease n=1 Tax=Streptomyces sp. NPDC051940 TaxID=3155675 RepID=UPI00343C20EA
MGAPPGSHPDDTLSPAELAAKYGLSVSGARPPLPEYVRQLWARRHFILAFSQAKLTAQYSKAKLGQVWHVATPLLNALVYYFIFGLLLGARDGIPGGSGNYVPFLIIGVFIYTFTQQSVMAGVKAIPTNLGLVRALHFPRASLPVSFALQQLQQLLYSMIVMILVLVAFHQLPTLRWPLILPALLLQFMFNSGLAMIMARAGAKTPDLAQLMPFILRTVMYASGVMFPLHYMITHPDRGNLPLWVSDIMQATPIAVYMDLVRYIFISDYSYADVAPHIWLLALGWAVVTFVFGFVYFWKAEERYGRG